MRKAADYVSLSHGYLSVSLSLIPILFKVEANKNFLKRKDF